MQLTLTGSARQSGKLKQTDDWTLTLLVFALIISYFTIPGDRFPGLCLPLVSWGQREVALIVITIPPPTYFYNVLQITGDG